MTDLRNDITATLGIRNNNPGNIRYSTSINWVGQVGINKGFVVFSSIEYGIRAMTKVIKSNFNAGRDTITEYITRYAPPSENDTVSYINRVSSLSGINPNIQLSSDDNTLFKLIKAQIAIENGASANLVSDKSIIDGINLANGISPSSALTIGSILIIGALLGTIFYLNK